MSLALSSAWLGDAAARLGDAARAARDAGFREVVPAVPPVDLATARPELLRLGLRVPAVGTPTLPRAEEADVAVVAAAPAAAATRAPLVLLDAGPLRAATDGAREPGVEALVRALHRLAAGAPGLRVAVRPGADADALLRFREVEWLLDALRGRGVGLWLDPARALLASRATPPEGGVAQPPPLAFADRFAKDTLAVAIHGLGGGRGGAHPEDDGPPWGTLRELVPARACRVLCVAPSLSRDEVVDARRRLEESLGW